MCNVHRGKCLLNLPVDMVIKPIRPSVQVLEPGEPMDNDNSRENPLQALSAFAIRHFPVRNLTRDDIVAGRPWYVRNGAVFKLMETLSVGAFLTAYALELGASNTVIGLLAAIPFLSQIVQIPAVFLVEKITSRRALAVTLTLLSRLCLILAAVAAILGPSPLAISLLVVAFLARYLLGAAAACAWNSWMRDYIPRGERGKFTAHRLSIMTLTGAFAAVAGGLFVDQWADLTKLPVVFAYMTLLSMAVLAGVGEAFTMAKIPEPIVEDPVVETAQKRTTTRAEKRNFARLLRFLFSWNFAVNLAAPFFAVHMLNTLGMSLTLVMLLTAISQAVNAFTTRVFGSLADRYSNKHVLQVAAPLFALSTFLWTFTGQPQSHSLTLPLLIFIHVLMGVATAGVTLATGNIANAVSPAGRANTRLALAAATGSVAAGLSPLIGGLFADLLANYELTLTVTWKAPGGTSTVPAFDVTHWDFYFLGATVLGLVSLIFLDRVEEPVGQGDGRVSKELVSGIWKGVQSVSTIPGIKAVSDVPIALITERLGRRRSKSPESEADGVDQK